MILIIHIAVLLAGVFGGLIVQIHHDNMWGNYNHRNGRAWGWRPYWKSNFSRK